MKSFAERVKARFPEQVTSAYSTPRGDDYVVVKAAAMREVAQFCKTDPELELTMFLSVCAVDRLQLPEPTPRFEVVYQVRQGRAPWKKLHLKTFLPEEAPQMPSLQPVWKGADWWERYTWDFYGIRFEGHPNLKRVLMYEEFQGHALRKDYPLRGRQPLTEERPFPDIIRGPGSLTPRPTSS